MSTFQLTNMVIDPPEMNDVIGGATLNALARPPRGKQAWGVVKTAVLAGVTFGLAPIFSWPSRFARFVTWEREQYRHLAQWIGQNVDQSQAADLNRLVEEMQISRVLWGLSLLCAGAVVAAIVWRLSGEPWPRWWDTLIAATYGSRHGVPSWTKAHSLRDLFLIWNAGLVTVYALHWLNVQAHASQVAKFVRAFNHVMQKKGLPLIQPARREVGGRPLWLLAGFAGVANGALWAIPMVMAGAAQKRYMYVTSLKDRRELAHRLRSLMQQGPLGDTVPMPVWLKHRCPNERCRATMPHGAVFCSRCGARMTALRDRMW